MKALVGNSSGILVLHLTAESSLDRFALERLQKTLDEKEITHTQTWIGAVSPMENKGGMHPDSLSFNLHR
jgi:hypothetical protein